MSCVLLILGDWSFKYYWGCVSRNLFEASKSAKYSCTVKFTILTMYFKRSWLRPYNMFYNMFKSNMRIFQRSIKNILVFGCKRRESFIIRKVYNSIIHGWGLFAWFININHTVSIRVGQYFCKHDTRLWIPTDL